MDYRVRSRRSEEWIKRYKGAQVTPAMLNVVLTGEARILKPDGKPLAVYLPGAALDVGAQTYPEFSRIRSVTDSRGTAAASERTLDRNQVRAQNVTSTILGSFEKAPRGGGRRDAFNPDNIHYCRLTAFTANEVAKWEALLPYFSRIAALFAEHVPARFAAQMREVEATSPDWIITGTPFTTITVNNTYPTGLHTDKGDLDAGFSTLGCIRRGAFEGGWLCFPQYGVGVDMQDGDVLLMDAHEWHGNTPITCAHCGELLRKPRHECEGTRLEPCPERISIVSYFRTDMVECGSMADENARRRALQERRASRALGITEETT